MLGNIAWYVLGVVFDIIGSIIVGSDKARINLCIFCVLTLFTIGWGVNGLVSCVVCETMKEHLIASPDIYFHINILATAMVILRFTPVALLILW